MTQLGVFDYVNSINNGRENLMRVDDMIIEGDYNPYLTNLALSYFSDTILHANMMNMNSHIPKFAQYEFYFNAVRKRKRFSKWHKAKKYDDLELVCMHYGVNRPTGREYIDILSKDQIDEIKKLYEQGGNE